MWIFAIGALIGVVIVMFLFDWSKEKYKIKSLGGVQVYYKVLISNIISETNKQFQNEWKENSYSPIEALFVNKGKLVITEKKGYVYIYWNKNKLLPLWDSQINLLHTIKAIQVDWIITFNSLETISERQSSRMDAKASVLKKRWDFDWEMDQNRMSAIMIHDMNKLLFRHYRDTSTNELLLSYFKNEFK